MIFFIILVNLTCIFKNWSYIQKLFIHSKICRTFKNSSYIQKLVIHSKIGHTFKNGSYIQK